MPKKKVLGRGLDALIPDVGSTDLEPGSFLYCAIGSIRPNPYQPRQRISNQELKELSASIKEKGIIQPLVVRSVSDGQCSRGPGVVIYHRGLKHCRPERIFQCVDRAVV